MYSPEGQNMRLKSLFVTGFVGSSLLVAGIVFGADTKQADAEEVNAKANNATVAPTQTTQRANEIVAPTQPAAVPNAGEQIKWQVISGGGSRGTSTNYILNGTVGQTAAGPVTSTNYKIYQGFWQNFSSGCCTGTTGNVNMVGIVDLSDLSALVSYLTGGGYVLPCVLEANVNNTGIVDLSDLSALVSYLTGGGYVLPSCP